VFGETDRARAMRAIGEVARAASEMA